MTTQEVEQALKTAKLKDMELKRELQLVQAKVAHLDAISEKGARVIGKGARRLRESRSHVRLLQTQLAQIYRETGIDPQICTSIEETESNTLRTQEEVVGLQCEFWENTVCQC